MKQIRKALLCLLIAALALSLCACERIGLYVEYCFDVQKDGKVGISYSMLGAVEDPDVDGDGEAETTEEIV